MAWKAGDDAASADDGHRPGDCLEVRVPPCRWATTAIAPSGRSRRARFGAARH